MLISLFNKFIFLASLKTASTAIEGALKQHAQIQLTESQFGKHMSFTQLEKKFSWLFNKIPQREFVVFGVIRDPVEFALSLYNSHKANRFRDRQDLYTGNMPFVEFRNVWLTVNSGQATPQSDRFIDSSGKLGANYIITYDRLLEGLNEVFFKLNVPVPQLKIENESPPGLKKDDLTKEDLGWCNQHFAQDYAFIDKYCNKFFDFDLRPKIHFS